MLCCEAGCFVRHLSRPGQSQRIRMLRCSGLHCLPCAGVEGFSGPPSPLPSASSSSSGAVPCFTSRALDATFSALGTWMFHAFQFAPRNCSPRPLTWHFSAAGFSLLGSHQKPRLCRVVVGTSFVFFFSPPSAPAFACCPLCLPGGCGFGRGSLWVLGVVRVVRRRRGRCRVRRPSRPSSLRLCPFPLFAPLPAAAPLSLRLSLPPLCSLPASSSPRVVARSAVACWSGPGSSGVSALLALPVVVFGLVPSTFAEHGGLHAHHARVSGGMAAVHPLTMFQYLPG